MPIVIRHELALRRHLDARADEEAGADDAPSHRHPSTRSPSTSPRFHAEPLVRGRRLRHRRPVPQAEPATQVINSGKDPDTSISAPDLPDQQLFCYCGCMVAAWSMPSPEHPEPVEIHPGPAGTTHTR
jgi:hypothetical protein